jgi:cyclopropane fatty-acyl-phospholipid synthase-like methyltransferase
LGADVLELACGGGIPVTRTLLKAGMKVWAVDSSPTLVAAFQARFPDTPVQCARVQDSDFFGRNFGAIVSIGLMFLLNEAEQIGLIRRASELLVPGGRFLFTAPVEIGTWADITTGYGCRSLGQERYEAALRESGFHVLGRYEDEGKNNHYDTKRTAEPVSYGAA